MVIEKTVYASNNIIAKLMCYAQHRFLQLLCGVLAFSVWPQDNSSCQYKWYTYSEGTCAYSMYYFFLLKYNNRLMFKVFSPIK